MIFYEVGGSVRDSLMNRRPNDTDMTAVIEASDWELHRMDPAADHPFGLLLNNLKLRSFRIVQEKWEFLTAKALGPPDFEFAGRLIKGPVDFVLARLDGPSKDRRRPDWVRPGSLQDDLNRRDFTVNAIARDSGGTLVDPHGGLRDIGNLTLRCVGAAPVRFREDALRMFRALRFSITHGFAIHESVGQGIDDALHFIDPLGKTSVERIQEELLRMFRHDTPASVRALQKYGLLDEAFKSRLWLKPTLEER